MSSQDSVARTGDVLCLRASQRLQLENRAEPVRTAVSQLRAAAESTIRERLERATETVFETAFVMKESLPAVAG